jgi:hypothetical protein
MDPISNPKEDRHMKTTNEIRTLSDGEIDAVSGAGEIRTGVVNLSYGDGVFVIGIGGVGAVGIDFQTKELYVKPTGGATKSTHLPA